MKLRIRVNKQSSRVELPGEEPTVQQLRDHVRDTVLTSHGLSPDTEFSLSLNCAELLSDTGQTLASCGIVSGDLICVLLPESVAPEAPAPEDPVPEDQIPEDMDSEAPAPEDMDPEAPAPCWEPMLCSEAEEGEAPLSLELLHHSASITSPSDALMVAGHLLMLETGFVPQASEVKPGEMPGGWRSTGGLFKLPYTHPLCESSLAVVVGVVMGPVLVINATLKLRDSVDTIRKLCVNPSLYVTDEWPGESAAAAFKHLSKLSRLFKDQLAYPLIAAAREAMALPVAFGLAALPPELLLRVLRQLDVCSVVRLASVCRYFSVVTCDSTLWRHLYRRDFPSQLSGRESSRSSDWRELYKQMHQTRERRRAPPPPHHHHRSPRDIYRPVPPPFPPPLPGTIGGIYDLIPIPPLGLLPPRFDPMFPTRHQDRRGRPSRGRSPDVRRGFI